MAKKNKNKSYILQNAAPIKNNNTDTTSSVTKYDAPVVSNIMETLEKEYAKIELNSDINQNLDAFSNKKDELLHKFKEEIKALDEQKNSLQKEIEDREQTLKSLKDNINDLELSLDQTNKKKDELIQKAQDEASQIKNDANVYAHEVKEKADKESMETLTKASDEARKIWHEKIENIKAQIEDIAANEAKLHEKEIILKKESNDIELKKEALDEEKNYLQEIKKRYEKASPEKIAELTTNLEDERNKYKFLDEQYNKVRDELSKIEVTLETIRFEINNPQEGVNANSLKDLVVEISKLRDENTRLRTIYQKYPDDNAIEALESKVKLVDKLEREKNELINERDKYREEVLALHSANRELEIIRQETDATNALNAHLLHELESHKTALESRTGDTCPSLSKIDAETENKDFIDNLNKRDKLDVINNLSDLVSHVKNFAGSRSIEKQLYYTDNDIRAFLSGMAVSRLIILQGMSGTGKSSLPRIFSEAISGFNRLIPVESSWRDRNELLGYYNDFNKKFNAKSFTIELYRSSKKCCRRIPTFIVLDEMNLARIEYYFSDFLAILQEPDHNKWLIDLVSSDMRTLPMELPDDIKAKMQQENASIFEIWKKIEKSRQGSLYSEVSDEDKEILTTYLAKLGQLTGAKDLIDGRKIKVTDNIWFVGTANRDESTFEISDKVYDRAQVVSLNKKGEKEKSYTPVKEKFISIDRLLDLFNEAFLDNKYKSEVIEKLNELDRVLIENFDQSFGNRMVSQTINFVGVFTAAGGTLDDALDYQISTKILRKVLNSDNEDALVELSDTLSKYKESSKLIEKKLKEF